MKARRGVNFRESENFQYFGGGEAGGGGGEGRGNGGGRGKGAASPAMIGLATLKAVQLQEITRNLMCVYIQLERRRTRLTFTRISTRIITYMHVRCSRRTRSHKEMHAHVSALVPAIWMVHREDT